MWLNFIRIAYILYTLRNQHYQLPNIGLQHGTVLHRPACMEKVTRIDLPEDKQQVVKLSM